MTDLTIVNQEVQAYNIEDHARLLSVVRRVLLGVGRH